MALFNLIFAGMAYESWRARSSRGNVCPSAVFKTRLGTCYAAFVLAARVFLHRITRRDPVISGHQGFYGS